MTRVHDEEWKRRLPWAWVGSSDSSNKEKHISHIKNKILKSIADYNQLSTAFEWSETSQGHSYWANLRFSGHDDISKSILYSMVEMIDEELGEKIHNTRLL